MWSYEQVCSLLLLLSNIEHYISLISEVEKSNIEISQKLEHRSKSNMVYII